MAATPPKKGLQLYAWPLGINLIILLLLARPVWPHVSGLGLAFVLLAVFNGLIGFIFLLFERRRDTGFAGGFFLSFLLLLLNGSGMCAQEAKPKEPTIDYDASN